VGSISIDSYVHAVLSSHHDVIVVYIYIYIIVYIVCSVGSASVKRSYSGSFDPTFYI
jgi:hypothetical protein